MSRKTASVRTARTASTRKTSKSRTSGSSSKTAKKVKKKAAAPRKPAVSAKRATSTKTGPPATKRASRPSGAKTRQAGKGATPRTSGSDQLLARAEADLTTAIDSLNNQMNAALCTLTELATAHTERGKAVVRTAPIDRATATFQRLVAEVLDDQLAEMLGPLTALRSEMAQRAEGNPDGDDDVFTRSTETLDHVLSLAGVESYDARVGDALDPLIHLAVGETRRDDLDDGTVAETLQPGFRSARGKVVVPAKVRVNRR